ncbi:MAG: hypothetical protein ACFB9M_10665 [Myxococcota bacterium]
MKVAAVDLGSNTVKMTVAQISGETIEVLDEALEAPRVVRGRDRSTGELQPEALERTFEVLRRFVARADGFGVDRKCAAATASLRGAPNAPGFLRRVAKELGLSMEVVSGEREAALAYLGATTRFEDEDLWVVDVGGRSTEVVRGRGRIPLAAVSRDVGAVSLTEDVELTDPPHEHELLGLRQAAAERLSPLTRSLGVDAADVPPSAKLVGVSGTALAALGLSLGESDLETLVRHHDGADVSFVQVEEHFHTLGTLRTDQRVFGTVLPEQRADVILAGLSLLLATMAALDADHMAVTHRGLRYGLLAESGGLT